MAARRKSRFPKSIFNESWIGGARVKANSRHSGKRTTVARFYPVFSKEKRSVLLSPLPFGTRMLGLKITARSQANFDRHTPIILMRPNMESETGRAAAARQQIGRASCRERV